MAGTLLPGKWVAKDAMRAPVPVSAYNPPEKTATSRAVSTRILTAVALTGAFLTLLFSPFSAAAQTDQAARPAQTTGDQVSSQDRQGPDVASPDLAASDLVGSAPDVVGSDATLVADVNDAYLGDQLATDYILQQHRADQAALDAAERRVQVELSVLAADAVALDRRLARLDESIVGQESLLVEISWHRDALAADQAALQVELQRTVAGLAYLDQEMTERAVAAYMAPTDGYRSEALVADDFVELQKKLALIDSVADADEAFLALMQEEEQRLVDQQLELAVLQDEAAQLLATEQVTSRSMAANRHEFEALGAVLHERIAAFTAEADSLAADRAAVAAIVADREDRFLAEAQARAELRAACEAHGPWPDTDEDADDEDADGESAGDESAGGATEGPAPQGDTAAPAGPTQQECATAHEPPAPTSVQWPAKGVFTSPFGNRWGRLHEGIDVAGPIGEPINAAEEGLVYFAGRLGGYGQTVLIDHGGGMHTLYAHQSELLVAEGDEVERGDVIGKMGSTGHSTGPHLHFEIQLDGVAVDPMDFLYSN